MKKLLERVKKRAFMLDRKGFSMLELLIILGITVLILGATYVVARTPITNWWDSKIMTQFPAS